MARPGVNPKPVPTPGTDEQLKFDAAKAMVDFRGRMADSARDSAAKADSYSDWTAAIEDWHKGNSGAAKDTLAPLGKRVDAAAGIGEDVPYDAGKWRAAMGQVEKGFRE